MGLVAKVRFSASKPTSNPIECNVKLTSKLHDENVKKFIGENP